MTQKRSWWEKHWRILAIATPVILVELVLLGYYVRPYWTGFGLYIDSAGELHPAKTLWDWMELLIIPAVLAIGGALFTWVQREAEREAETRRAESERRIAAELERERALKAYFDDMTQLILSEQLYSDEKKGHQARTIARARTLTALRQLDGERKGLLLQFLSESVLIEKEKAIVEFHEADLSEVKLWDANLREVDLKKTNLREAVAAEANFDGADLRGIDLFQAFLPRSSLSRANLSGAKLNGADLRSANVSGADLSGATLIDAKLDKVDLRRANLQNAFLADEQLMVARSLKGATMPDGSRYNGRFNLEGDIEAAREEGIDVADPEAMAHWYAGESLDEDEDE